MARSTREPSCPLGLSFSFPPAETPEGNARAPRRSLSAARTIGHAILKAAHFCFQAPPASWYHQPVRALEVHCLAKVSRICDSHSG